MVLEVLTEEMIMAILLAVALAVIGRLTRMWPVVLISSIGWVIISMMWLGAGGGLLPAALMWMLAFAQLLGWGPES